jgi:hypothetical protein
LWGRFLVGHSCHASKQRADKRTIGGDISLRGGWQDVAVSGPIGPEQLSEDDRRAFAEARDDPRLGRDRGSMIADFRIAMDEAERMRELGAMGLYELTRSVEHEEQRLGVYRGDPSLNTDDGAALQAAWARAELARIEEANEHPHLHATALIAMLSALDGMVEELVPAFRQMLVEMRVRKAAEHVNTVEAKARATLTEGQVEAAIAALRDHVVSSLPPVRRAKGKGISRYEDALSQVGLGSPPDRPIPEDLDEAVTEVGVLRDVLVHRAGRVDTRGLEQAPSLGSRYTDGNFVRLDRADYRRYSAAIRCYGAEIARRAMLGLYDNTEHDVDLTQWQGWYRLNA